jgi:hypothetical protein
MLAELYVVRGRESGKALELGPGSSVSCGRALSNDLRVRDPQVSRIHCRIECGEDEVRLKDTSGNGTFVNDERIEDEVVLHDDDRVRLGSTELRVLIETDDEAHDHANLPGAEQPPSSAEAVVESLAETAIDQVRPSSTPAAASSLSAGPRSAPRARARRPDVAPDALAPANLPPPLGATPRAAPSHHDTETGLAPLREIIPGYRIESKLGGGGRRGTVVYRALQLALDRSVALKVLLPTAREADLGRFLRESAAVARLPHPNIVTIHDAGRSGERRYIVMELLGGGSVEDRLDDGPLRDEDAVTLGADVARALAFAHVHGIVHRGVRPANVLRDAFGTWKLVDFGLSKDLVRGSGSETSFLDAPPKSLCYLAPEQLEHGGGDARSDVYGLGAVLYHGLVGRPPFGGINLGEVIDALARKSEPEWEPLVRAARPPLAAIVRRCLERDPARRYPSGEALLQDLLAARAAEAPVRTRPGRPAGPA